MRSRPPDASGAAVPRQSDDHEPGVIDRKVYRSLPASLHDHGPRQEPVEELCHGRIPGTCMQAEPSGALSEPLRPRGPSVCLSARERRAPRRRSTGRGDRNDSARRPLACEVCEALSGCLLALHEHGGKRLPRRRLEGCLVTLVDVDELHQGPEHACDRGQPACTRPGPRLVKCLGEGLRPCRPLMTFGIRRPALVFGRRQCSLRRCLLRTRLLD